jgi:hypothetical protein
MVFYCTGQLGVSDADAWLARRLSSDALIMLKVGRDLLIKAVILNRCATSLYQVCREFLLETVFKY